MPPEEARELQHARANGEVEHHTCLGRPAGARKRRASRERLPRKNFDRDGPVGNGIGCDCITNKHGFRVFAGTWNVGFVVISGFSDLLMAIRRPATKFANQVNRKNMIPATSALRERRLSGRAYQST